MENQTMTLAEKALLMHEKWNGKLETIAKSKVNSREDLAIAYTPGVAEPCKMIAKDPEAAYKYTMKANTVAVVSHESEHRRRHFRRKRCSRSRQYRRIRRHACHGGKMRSV